MHEPPKSSEANVARALELLAAMATEAAFGVVAVHFQAGRIVRFEVRRTEMAPK